MCLRREARKRVYLYPRQAASLPVPEDGRGTEAGCKPLNNISRGDRWVACRSFLLAKPIKARGSDSSRSSHLHLSFDCHHHYHHHHHRVPAHEARIGTRNTDWIEKGNERGSRGSEGKREARAPGLGPQLIASI